MIRNVFCVAIALLALRMGSVAGQEGERTPSPTGAGIVTGTVFHDCDADGVRDEGEEGLAGWDISVSSVCGNTCYVQGGGTFSEADGSYRIEGLDETWSAWDLYADWYRGSVISQYYKVVLPQQFSFEDSAARIDIPVAYADDTSVTFRVWEDFDEDGAISAGDELALWTDVAIETREGERVFGASGPVTSLTLKGLLPGKYLARAFIDPLDEALFTIPEAGSAEGPVEMLSKPAVTFYGYVYEDGNENGLRDPGERSLPEAEIEIEERWADGSAGVGRNTEPDGSYVLTDDLASAGDEKYVGCSYHGEIVFNERGEGISTGFWRRTIGMSGSHHGLWFLEASVTIAPGVYRYPVDCGLVFEAAETAPALVPPSSGGSVSFPSTGTGSGDGLNIGRLASILAGVGALLLGWALGRVAQRLRRELGPIDVAAVTSYPVRGSRQSREEWPGRWDSNPRPPEPHSPNSDFVSGDQEPESSQCS
jgi:hypothetical protein